ncbi:hypothetical protein Taro_009549 [Colocasia esculenta]|uniref:Floricaula/leafy-like transcription factor n=88 Tax=Araceae TaxID=4454 RepID=A0A843TWM2_COLES|nr:hypothetical protein [Colocasia esculenta]
MDPADSFTAANAFRCWDPRVGHPSRLIEAAASLLAAQVEAGPAGAGGGAAGGVVVAPYGGRAPPPARGELEEMFQAYGVRYQTVEKIGELGFTASTLAAMREEELDDMMAALCHVFRWELLVGERYGIKAAVRNERRRRQLDGFLLQHAEEEERRRRQVVLSPDSGALDALSQEGLSEERIQQEREAVGSGGEAWEGQKQREKGSCRQLTGSSIKKKKKTKKKPAAPASKDDNNVVNEGEEDEDDDDNDEDDRSGGTGAAGERQREHPFIVTEPGEVARGKKNGLDYLFHLYDQCREFLLQVQNLARERGHKCPTKVTNQVFRYAKEAGASYINKPKMRHYVHCYALHCLDEEASNALRRAFKEKGENVGAWRQACYQPLVAMSARHGWDVDALFNSHPRLAIWYVPTKLRQLCHLSRSTAAAAAATGSSAHGLPAVPYLF